MNERIRQFLKSQWDTLTALLAAIVLSVLSVLDVIDDSQVAAATLGVLALVCVTVVKDRHMRSTEAAAADVIRSAEQGAFDTLTASIAAIDDRIRFGDEVEAVPPPSIGQHFGEALEKTNKWRFKGGTGTYLRAETLPGMAKRAGREIWIEAIDPEDVELCARYATFREQLSRRHDSSQASEPWTVDRARIEAYATIIAAIWYSSHAGLRVHVALSSTMSSIRYDLSDDFVMITNESGQARAFCVHNIGSSLKVGSFFRSVDFEMVNSHEQARQLDVGKARLPANGFRADDVREALIAVGLTSDGGFLGDSVCDEIGLRAISEKHASDLGFTRGGAKNPYP